MMTVTNMFNVLEVEKPNRSLGSQTAEAENNDNHGHLKSYNYDDQDKKRFMVIYLYDDHDNYHDS